MYKRWSAFTRILDDGRICLTNNCAERELRGVALGRKSWLSAGSDRGGERAAAMYTLIATARVSGVDPQAWLADVLERINDHKITDLAALLPWLVSRSASPKTRGLTRDPASFPRESAQPAVVTGRLWKIWPAEWLCGALGVSRRGF